MYPLVCLLTDRRRMSHDWKTVLFLEGMISSYYFWKVRPSQVKACSFNHPFILCILHVSLHQHSQFFLFFKEYIYHYIFYFVLRSYTPCFRLNLTLLGLLLMSLHCAANMKDEQIWRPHVAHSEVQCFNKIICAFLKKKLCVCATHCQCSLDSVNIHLCPLTVWHSLFWASPSVLWPATGLQMKNWNML